MDWKLESRHKASSPTKKRSCRSFLPIVSERCLQYCQKKHVGPFVLTFPENEASEFIFDDACKRYFPWSLMQVRSSPQSVPSWNGLQILVCSNFPVLRTTSGYLDCIESSMTEMSTIYQWRRGPVVITTAQFHSTKPELRFCARSNPTGGVSEIREGEDLWQWSQLEIRLNTFLRSTIPQKQFIIIIIIPGKIAEI